MKRFDRRLIICAKKNDILSKKVKIFIRLYNKSTDVLVRYITDWYRRCVRPTDILDYVKIIETNDEIQILFDVYEED